LTRPPPRSPPFPYTPLFRPRAVALDRERDLLQPCAVVRARAELLDLEPAALGVAGQHSVDVARPEGRLVPADALPDLDDDVLAVDRKSTRLNSSHEWISYAV